MKRTSLLLRRLTELQTRMLLSLLTVLGLAITNMTVPAQGAAPGKDSLAVVAQPSSPTGATPTNPGNALHQWFYAFSLTPGQSLNETFPVEYTLTNTNLNSGESVQVSLNPVGSLANLSGTTVAAPGFAISDTGIPETHNINVATGPLAAGDYVLNVQISGTPANKVQLSHSTIHIQVYVGNEISCFFTDGDFVELSDCAGNPVSSNSGGSFVITASNGKVPKVASTDPGQFYYNLLWTNYGATQDVTINFSADNLVPQGQNAVHAMVFNEDGFVQDATRFDMVNEDGTPCGPSGPCTIEVPYDHTLWVTWHVEYEHKGVALANFSTPLPQVCSPDATTAESVISATGTLTDAFGNSIGSCTATACGYKP